MPPKKRRRQEYSKEEWKVERGRRYRKKKNVVKGSTDTEVTAGVDPRGPGYADIIKENSLFEKYYQGLGFIPASDWPSFISSMKESLPVVFRITGTRSLANHVLSCLKKRFFAELVKLEVDGEQVSPPTPLPWYPGNLAWNVPLTRKFIRKSPLLAKFHGFLVRESEQGNISRQEAVSMIPPLVLDVKPSHKVLDMCAAPGSKTAQLIESLHAEDGVSTPIPSGVVVANDSNNKRCYMLVHQAKRLNSPCFIVTNHDASVFPMLYYHDENDVRHPIHYDRVLCDVPCSGDGTLRKNPTIWRSWTPLLGPSLHKLQLRILNRGLELLAPQGRLVYSTCSLNPIENEAVVAAALGLCKGSVGLVDCKAMLPGLITLDGLTSWKAMSKEGEWLEEYDGLPKSSASHFSRTMFPPENVDTLGLEKCIRVLPHYQDSGGFFIAVFEKKDWLPWQSKKKRTQTKDVPSSSYSPPVDNTHQEKPQELEEVIKDGTLSLDQQNAANSHDVQATAVVGDDDAAMESVVFDRVTPEASAPNSDHVTSEASGPKSDDDAAIESVVSDHVTPEASDPNSDRVTSEASGPKSDHETERPTTKILGRPDFQKKKMRGFKEDPYIFFENDSDFFNSIRPYYGLPEDFPLNQMLTRSRIGKKRNIYFSSRLIKEITIRNEHVVKIINIGVKVMSRCEYSKTLCQFRLCQEGVESLIPYIYNHRVHVKQGDLSILLKEANPFITSLSTCAQDELQPLGVGPVVFVYVPDENDIDNTHFEGISEEESSEINITCPLYLSGWLAARSVRLYLDKNYRYHFLSMLGYDPPSDQCLDTLNSNRGGRGSNVTTPGGDNPLPDEDKMVEGDEVEDDLVDGGAIEGEDSGDIVEGTSGEGCVSNERMGEDDPVEGESSGDTVENIPGTSGAREGCVSNERMGEDDLVEGESSGDNVESIPGTSGAGEGCVSNERMEEGSSKSAIQEDVDQ